MKVIMTIKEQLKRKNIGAVERAQLEANLSRASKMLDYSEKYVPRK